MTGHGSDEHRSDPSAAVIIGRSRQFCFVPLTLAESPGPQVVAIGQFKTRTIPRKVGPGCWQGAQLWDDAPAEWGK